MQPRSSTNPVAPGREAEEATGLFSTIDEAIDEIRRGRMVVVCDDENRENEGDLTLAAQFATPEAINFMAKEGRGLICLALSPERCDELELNLMAAKNEAPLQTAFTVSVEARHGVTTGISAADRAHTIQVAIDPGSAPQDLVQPGHVFPLKAKDGGVLERAGQTEAAVDLARLAGLNPAGVICEIMNDDGTMARPGLLLRAPRAEDDHGRRPDRLSAPDRAPGRARGRDQAADRVRRVHRGRLPLPARRQAPRRDGQGGRRERRRGAGPRPLGMPHR
jgi:3,4-dihydroxy-2-butanone 4-phosphate synthase